MWGTFDLKEKAYKFCVTKNMNIIKNHLFSNDFICSLNLTLNHCSFRNQHLPKLHAMFKCYVCDKQLSINKSHKEHRPENIQNNCIFCMFSPQIVVST